MVKCNSSIVGIVTFSGGGGRRGVPLPLGAWDRIPYLIVALPEPPIYFFKETCLTSLF